jgi:hypothetical protein
MPKMMSQNGGKIEYKISTIFLKIHYSIDQQILIYRDPIYQTINSRVIGSNIFYYRKRYSKLL